MANWNFALRLPTDLAETLRRQAAVENRSLNNLIQTMILEGLQARGALRTVADLPHIDALRQTPR